MTPRPRKVRRDCPTDTSPRALWTCMQAATLLQVKPAKVRQWCRRGKLRQRVIVTPGGTYRIPWAVLEALLHKRSLPPPTQTHTRDELMAALGVDRRRGRKKSSTNEDATTEKKETDR